MDSKDIKIIKAAFHQMKTKEDFLALLNLAKPFVYGDKAVPFELKQLTWYANPNSKSRRYTEFKIKKKSGAERSINAPVKGLKAIQKTISFILQCVFEPHKSAMGFAKDKSVVDNAKIHEGNNYVYNIDLKDFFSSIDQARVWKTLQLKPFNLFEERAIAEETLPLTGVDELPQIEKLGDLKYLLKPELKRGRLHLANMIASLCCAELEVERKDEHGQWKMVKRNVLPQGAPSSPVVTNIICQKLDHRLSGLAKRFGLKYSRYADDITFSSMHNVYQNDSDFITELNRIIADQNFHIKDSKTRLQKEGYRQEVTGLLVNDKANVQKRYVKQLRMWLFYWERYGLEKATNIFTQNYTANKSNLGSAKPNMANVIKGKLDYLKMVKGGKDKTYLKLRERYDHLIVSIKKNKAINPTEVTNDNIIEAYGGIEEIKKLAEESKVFIDRVRNSNNANHEEAPPANPQETEETEIPRWTINELSEYIKNDPELSKHILRKNKKAQGYTQQKQQPKSEEPKVSETNPFASIPGLITDPDEMDEILAEYYAAEGQLSNTESSDSLTQIRIIKPKNNLPLVHTPKDLVTFLKKFSVNNSALKYTTHSWDAGRDSNMFKDLTEFLSIAKSQYNEFSHTLKGLSKNLNGKIYNFLFNKEIAKSGWGDINPKKRIYFGWSSPELLEACNKDISLNPEDFILPEKYQVQRAGKTLQKFKHIIDVFKNEIEVRDENSALLNLILQKHDHYLINFSAPKISNLENKTFYTDIQWLSKALDLIFKGIQDRPQHRIVEYLVTENNNEKLVLNILHKESYKKGTTIYDEKLNLTRGDLGPIKDYLTNLCDWSIESEFAEGAYRINYLVSDKDIPAYEKIMSAEGFKHILTFYK